MLTDELAATALRVRTDETNSAQWSEMLQQFDDASVYQTWAYGAVHWNERQLSHLVVESGSKVVGMAQVRVVRLPLLRSGIAYIRWGPVCRRRGESFDSETLREVTKALKTEYVDRRKLVLRILPPVFTGDTFAASWESTWSSLGITRNEKLRAYRTMRVDLSPTIEDLRSGLHQRWRNYLKASEKAGFKVHSGTAVEYYDKFLEAYREMMARKRFETTVDVNEFRRVQLQLPDPLRMQVFLCEKDGKVFNVLVVAVAGDTGIYLLAATSNEGLNGKGAHLLQWRAIEWLKSRGCRWYELGGINPEKNPGVFQFKNGMGGQEAQHLGAFELSESWMGAACVRSGETLQSAAQKVRSLAGRMFF